MSTEQQGRIWPISLHQIEATVSAYLGPGRVAGNCQDSAFSRQVAMYLAKHVGRWSTRRSASSTTVATTQRCFTQLRESSGCGRRTRAWMHCWSCSAVSFPPGVHMRAFCRLTNATRRSRQPTLANNLLAQRLVAQSQKGGEWPPARRTRFSIRGSYGG
jgi:hypothetical protein